MARDPATRAHQAADDLWAWLDARGPEPRFSEGDAGREPPPFGELAAGDVPRAATSFPAAPVSPVGAHDRRVFVPAHTDWLHHQLQIEGPAEHVKKFRKAAAGAGVIPWHLDLDRIEEDSFHRLVAPPPGHARTLSLEGARIVAAELRDAVARRHALAVARVGRSHACPFDLHALVPVPEAVLRLGPDHPDALAWLWTRWGTNQALRHVASELAPASRPPAPDDTAVFRVSFWSADWTPWRALAAIQAQWPALRFKATPQYELA